MSHKYKVLWGRAHEVPLSCGKDVWKPKHHRLLTGDEAGILQELTMSVLSPTGLHVFPTFVVYELTVLMVLTLSVVIMKVRVPLGASGLVKFLAFLV